MQGLNLKVLDRDWVGIIFWGSYGDCTLLEDAGNPRVGLPECLSYSQDSLKELAKGCI